MRALLFVLAGCSFHRGQAAAPGAPDAEVDAEIDAVPDVAIDAPATTMRTLTIDSTLLANDVTNIPIYLSLDATRVNYGAVADPNRDLRFVDPVTSSDVAFEIDHWAAGGESGVWIQVPVLHHGTTDQIVMIAGPAAAGTADAASTWNNGYLLVEHFAPALANSASANYTGTLAGATLGTGQLGSAAMLGGGMQAVTFATDGALLDGWCTFTVDFWIRADYANGLALGTNEPHFLEKGSSLDLPRIYNAGGAINLQIDMHFTNGNDAYLAAPIQPMKWTYIAYTFDMGTLRMYRDGVEVANQSITQCLVAATGSFTVGSQTTNVITGALDEVRISNLAHSSGWIVAQYLAMARLSITY